MQDVVYDDVNRTTCGEAILESTTTSRMASTGRYDTSATGIGGTSGNTRSLPCSFLSPELVDGRLDCRIDRGPNRFSGNGVGHDWSASQAHLFDDLRSLACDLGRTDLVLFVPRPSQGQRHQLIVKRLVSGLEFSPVSRTRLSARDEVLSGLVVEVLATLGARRSPNQRSVTLQACATRASP